MEAADRVAAGDYSTRVTEYGPPPIRLLARAFNLPEPLVHSAGIFVFAQVQAVETRAAKSLCPLRLLRQLRARLRKTPTHPATKGELP